MAVLKIKNGEIEVRIAKRPLGLFVGRYFDEYAPLVESPITKQSTVYIVPESTKYGIEIKFKAGYVHDKYDGSIKVKLYDILSGKMLYNEHQYRISKECTRFNEDKVFLITSLSSAIVEGKERENVALSFRSIASDFNTNVSEKTEPQPQCSSGIRVVISLLSKATRIKSKKYERYSAEMEEYELKLRTRREGYLAPDTIQRTDTFDQKSYEKEGVQHTIGLSGGRTPTMDLKQPKAFSVASLRSAHLEFNFLYRSADYLGRQTILKTPIHNYPQTLHSIPDVDGGKMTRKRKITEFFALTRKSLQVSEVTEKKRPSTLTHRPRHPEAISSAGNHTGAELSPSPKLSASSASPKSKTTNLDTDEATNSIDGGGTVETHKRIKLEPTFRNVNEDEILEELKTKDKELQAELDIIMEAARLIKEKNENNAKIAALEAKRKQTTSSHH